MSLLSLEKSCPFKAGKMFFVLCIYTFFSLAHDIDLLETPRFWVWVGLLPLALNLHYVCFSFSWLLQDSLALARLDDLYLESFDITDGGYISFLNSHAAFLARGTSTGLSSKLNLPLPMWFEFCPGTSSCTCFFFHVDLLSFILINLQWNPWKGTTWHGPSAE